MMGGDTLGTGNKSPSGTVACTGACITDMPNMVTFLNTAFSESICKKD